MPVPHTVPVLSQVSLLVPTFPDDCPPDQILPADCVFTDLRAASYPEALALLAQRLQERGRIPDATQCLEDILARERLSPTMLEHDIALPRARTAQVAHLLAALALCRLELPDASRERTVIIVLSLSPKEHASPYMQFIAHIARVLLNHPDLDALRQIRDPAQLRNTFL